MHILVLLFILVIVASFIALIIGLIKPSIFPAKLHPTRLKIGLFFGLLLFILLGVLGTIGSSKEITLWLYKDEKRLNLTDKQIFNNFERGATISYEPAEKSEGLFGEYTSTLRSNDGCYKITVNSRYDKVKDVSLSFSDVYTDNDNDCTDSIMLVLLFFPNIIGEQSEQLQLAARTTDELIKEGIQSKSSVEKEFTVDEKVITMSFTLTSII